MARQNLFGFGQIDPFEDMQRLQDEVNRLFSSRAAATPYRSPGGYPAINAFANEGAIAITAELPGVRAEDLDISVFRDTLTLRGVRPAPEEAKAHHRRERRHGEFVRTVNLPFRVDPDRVEASMTDGVLRLSLYRPHEDQPRRIRVKTG
jgi:HSP20 family protein